MTINNLFNIDNLIKTINNSGSVNVIISEINILEERQFFRLIYNDKVLRYSSLEDMKNNIENILKSNCNLLENISFS